VHNFTDVYSAIDRAGGALPVSDGQTLADALAGLLADPGRIREMARAAGDSVAGLAGAIERTMQAVEPFIMQLKLETR
jgi:3-deoxy-D-manno-octulosonic-acid transferase